jgi:hypothetical protein
MIESLHSRDQADAAFLEKLRVRELAACRVLATDHSNQPEVGLDESLSGPLSAGF